ncbi:MAG: Kelch repeat-containing protein [Alphaproteobacteria bacterium]
MKTKSKIGGYIIRAAVYAVLFSVGLIAFTTAFNSPNGWHASSSATDAYDVRVKVASTPRALSFAERVAYQRAIEDVYWRHRIWPKDNPDPKPPLDVVMSQAQVEKKVENYVRDSLVLEDYWQKPITAEQLQDEMDRMARDTKQPEVLRELFNALRNDPAVIAECLARPILAERLLTDLSVQDETRWFDSPRIDSLSRMSLVTTLGQFVYTLPGIADGSDSLCTDDTWTATTAANAPSARSNHTAVWTGTEMIIWGGNGNTGGRYNPSTDSWTPTSTATAPTGRSGHTAVWTGTEMIVWGGYDGSSYLNTGGKYNPATNTWIDTDISSAPEARAEHTSVWTGSEMIIWGGSGNLIIYPPSVLGSGGKYNPARNTWTAISGNNTPEGRFRHTAVWTDTEMIVWGGAKFDWRGFEISLGTGGKYNPITNDWTTTSTANAPHARYLHTAVWTGSEMIVWGGSDGSDVLNTGGRYDPGTDSWTSTSTSNAPQPREFHTAVWTGLEMIVWGGLHTLNYFNTGGRYNPGTDAWAATSLTNAPIARDFQTAVSTGTEMIVWGGYSGMYPEGILSTGGRYCVRSGPTPTATPNPTPTAWPSITPRPRPTPLPRATRPPRPTRPLAL